MELRNVANCDNISLFFSVLTTCKVNAWEKLEERRKYKNGRIGAWCENDVSWGFTHKVKENVIPVYSVKNLNSLKSMFSLGPILSSVICGSALPLFPTYSGL